MRILLVEDSLSLSEALCNVFKRENYEVEAVYDGEAGLEYGSTGVFDVIVLDVLMPKMNGMEVLAELRRRKVGTPIIMLTALSQESDKISGLDAGADDYLPKPFSTPELLARIRALTRRHGDVVVDNILTYKDVVLNMASYTLSYKDKSVKLSKKEFALMRIFMENPTAVAEKDNLIAKAWGLDPVFESNSLEAFMSFLRKKLEFLDSPFGINSVRGVGYQLG